MGWGDFTGGAWKRDLWSILKEELWTVSREAKLDLVGFARLPFLALPQLPLSNSTISGGTCVFFAPF